MLALLVGVIVPADAGVPSGNSRAVVVVGFGDSVAAGYRAGQPSTSPYAALCERTDAAYPTKVGHALGVTTVNVACSSATAAAGLNGPQKVGADRVPAQLAQARTLRHIDLATITILANDVKWSSWLAQCIDPTINCATATNTAAFRLLLLKGGAGLTRALHTMVYDLRIDQVEVTGYYDPLGALAGTPDLPLLPAEVTWYRARLADVNNAIKTTTRFFPHVSFVPVSLDATAGDIILQENGIFHPTDQGQEKFAAAVLAQYRHLAPTG